MAARMKGPRLFCALILAWGILGSMMASAQEVNPPAYQRGQSTSQLMADIKPENDRATIKWKLMTGGRFYSEDSHDMTAATMGFLSQFDWRFTDILDLKSKMSLIMNNERSQLRYGDAEFEQGIRLRYAVMRLKPVRFVELGAGALDQGFLHAPILVDERAFPGVYGMLCWCSTPDMEGNYAYLKAQSTVPSSRSLNAERIEKEPLPSFTTQTLAASWKVNQHLKVSPFYSLFQYKKLPSKVAFESDRLGNSTIGDYPTNAQFFYGFSGYVTGGAVELQITPRVTTSVDFLALENIEAPEAYNSGRMLGGAVEISFDDVTIKPGVVYYYNESDTSPAYYNRNSLGSNNRQGNGVRLDMTFPKHGFKLVGEYIKMNVINSDPELYQSQGQLFQFKLETLYAEI